ncbi:MULTISPECIES: hypothetical protein [Gracilibacillus]|uniref:Uncharacterized protein n=1 Tax=Gracilibacillus dipsosauri TaxID=178340 RepID=A0A317KV58_9BACI|nr:hypothetical protein [Gracilibacillus dipsosauri]PWU67295.1 hypothetical protein DLJ74_17165 [Gracilibacillus dipsosauri]
MALVNRLSLLVVLTLASLKSNLTAMVENRKVQFDGWFIVLLAVLLTLAFTIFAGLTIWCLVYQGGSFSGNWSWHKWGVSVKAECV